MSFSERPARNPFEIALWVSAAIALAISTVGAVSFFEVGTSWCDTPECSMGVDLMWRQFGYFITPSTLVGGIILIGIALALRATEWNRRRVSVEAEAALDLAGGAVGVPATVAGAATESADAVPTGIRSGRATPDHRLYMRPSN